jgi:hypothetical protein
MIPILADAASESVSPTAVGVFVLIAIQLSQFFFAYRKDQRMSEAAKKEDLTVLRTELKGDIGVVAKEVDQLKDSVELKMEASRKESERSRGETEKTLSEHAVKTARLIEGVETLKQTSIATNTKLDRLLARNQL